LTIATVVDEDWIVKPDLIVSHDPAWVLEEIVTISLHTGIVYIVVDKSLGEIVSRDRVCHLKILMRDALTIIGRLDIIGHKRLILYVLKISFYTFRKQSFDDGEIVIGDLVYLAHIFEEIMHFIYPIII